jgi:hypothetical protein
MKRDSEDLIDDLLKDDVPSGFHAALMSKTLRTARRRHHAARLTIIVCGIGLVGMAALLFKSGIAPVSTTERIRQPGNIASAAPVVTHLTVQMVATQADPHLKIIETDKLAKPTLINDEQLFALMGHQPAALIRHGKGNAELILLGSVDVEAFSVSPHKASPL